MAEPSFAAGVLSDLMGMLGNSCQRLATMRPTPAGDGSAATGPGPARGIVPENMKRAINSVNGYALGVASLLGASTRCAKGRSYRRLLLVICIGISYARTSVGAMSATLTQLEKRNKSTAPEKLRP